MKIETGGKDLLESETFIALGKGETVITIGEGNEELRFVFDFVKGKKDEKPLEWNVVDTKSLKLTLTNWDNPLGTTLVGPVQVGTFRNRQLFILFYVEKAGKAGDLREVTVSLYLGEEVQGGQN